MICKTVSGLEVSLIDKKEDGTLLDAKGGEWVRDAENDRSNMAAYTMTAGWHTLTDTRAIVLFDKHQLKRICAGVKAMNRIETVAEAFDFISRLGPSYESIAGGWSTQRIRAIMTEADEKNTSANELIKKYIEAELNRPIAENTDESQEKAIPSASSAGGPPVPTGKPNAADRPRKPSRKRTKADSISVSIKNGSVSLTPKQTEFLERMSENPGWKVHNISGTYAADTYADCLSDTMSAMGVGAMITTLREKGLLTTGNKRIDGRKVCQFRFTDLGAEVYAALCSKGSVQK